MLSKAFRFGCYSQVNTQEKQDSDVTVKRRGQPCRQHHTAFQESRLGAKA